MGIPNPAQLLEEQHWFGFFYRVEIFFLLCFCSKAPCYDIYKTKDGHISVGALEHKFWVPLCKAIGAPDLMPHAMATGAEGQRTRQRLGEIFATKSESSRLHLPRRWIAAISPTSGTHALCRWEFAPVQSFERLLLWIGHPHEGWDCF